MPTASTRSLERDGNTLGANAEAGPFRQIV